MLTRHPELETHHPLYGDRTVALRLHYKLREGEESLEYLDVHVHPYMC